MIVDSSALPEQVTRDVVASSFQSAGQRCSALRVLFVQDDVADTMLAMIAGAMKALGIGDPRLLTTDVGPVIDAEAKAALDAHLAELDDARQACSRGSTCRRAAGHFVAPAMVEIALARRPRPRAFRADPPRRALEIGRARQGHRRDQRHRLRPDARACRAASTRRASTSSAMPASAISTSTATRSARWSKASRSAARGCRGPAPRPAARIMSRASRPSA